ncbi:unnamed protein product [Ixodes hexagonus]
MIASFDPERYSNVTGDTKPRNMEALMITEFRRPSSDCEQMLDIGCGTGSFTRDVLLPWSKPCRKMVAIDAVQTMVDYAKANYAHPDVRYEVLDAAGDVTKFLDKHGRFHRIYSFYCLHWIRDQKAAFANIGKLLKDGGGCLLLFCAQFIFYDVWLEMAESERWRNVISHPMELFLETWRREPRTSLSDLETSVRQLVADSGMVTRNFTVYPATPCVFDSSQGVLGKV